MNFCKVNMFRVEGLFMMSSVMFESFWRNTRTRVGRSLSRLIYQTSEFHTGVIKTRAGCDFSSQHQTQSGFTRHVLPPLVISGFSSVSTVSPFQQKSLRRATSQQTCWSLLSACVPFIIRFIFCVYRHRWSDGAHYYNSLNTSVIWII